MYNPNASPAWIYAWRLAIAGDTVLPKNTTHACLSVVSFSFQALLLFIFIAPMW